MRPQIGSTLVFMSALVLAAFRANAGEVLDQSYPGGDSMNAISGLPAPVSTAQTFTVGVSGILSRIAVDVSPSPGDEDLSVRILTTIGGIPDSSAGSVLGLTTVPASSIAGTRSLLSVPLTGPPIQVTKGEVLAIALSTSGKSYGWYGNTVFGTAYADGTAFQNFGGATWLRVVDVNGLGAKGYSESNAFETYVTVPEPVGVAAVGLVALLHRRRRCFPPASRST